MIIDEWKFVSGEAWAEDGRQGLEIRVSEYQEIRVQIIRTAGYQVKNKRADSVSGCQPFGQL